jgi:hypothetical protein
MRQVALFVATSYAKTVRSLQDQEAVWEDFTRSTLPFALRRVLERLRCA